MPAVDRFLQLRQAAPAILPSLLLCDFANLEREIHLLEGSGVRALHLDVMDGHFVPNLTYGMPIVEACRRVCDLVVDVHLMIESPEKYVADFARAGADSLTVHIEACPQPATVLEQIRELGCAAGLALNPETPLEDIDAALDHCQQVLVMSVSPGFGGQAFHPVALDKLRALRDRKPELLLGIDGGVNDETIGACAAAGADLFIVGSAIFRHIDYHARVSALRADAVAYRP